MIKPIINLFRTEQEALAIKNSQMNRYYINNGVQLLPKSEFPYVQVTDTPDGLHLEDWVVKVLNVCNNEVLGDITSSFMVESLTNSTNGNPQIIWSLTNIPLDFGFKLIYLQIEQSVGETFYS